MKNKLKNTKAQIAIEYVLLFGIFLIAVLATGIIDRVRNSFYAYFDQASRTIVAGEPQAQVVAPPAGGS